MVVRSARFSDVCQKIGTDRLIEVESGNGWPGVAESVSRATRLALHVSSVGSHARKDYELRFQNPGQNKPVDNTVGYPLLLGDAGDVFILADGSSRVGRNTRFSILFPTSLIEEARQKGWGEYISNSDEMIYAFQPILFELALSKILDGSIDFDKYDVQNVFDASGFEGGNDSAARDRLRRTVSAIARNSMFSGNVRKAYQSRCAMCGIDCGVVVGAHIYPASAPQSQDSVPNGMALCQNHHTMFDNHKIWVAPHDWTIKFHPDIHREAQSYAITQSFIDSTFEKIAIPTEPNCQPNSQMFQQRYNFFDGKYEWV